MHHQKAITIEQEVSTVCLVYFLNISCFNYCFTVTYLIFHCFQSARAELEKLWLGEKHDRDFMDPSLRDRASIIAHCLEHKDDKLQNRARKHRSFNCLEDTEAEVPHSLPKGYKGLKTLKKTEDRNSKTTLDADHKLPSKVIEELSVVLQRSRTLPKELLDEQTSQKEIK